MSMITGVQLRSMDVGDRALAMMVGGEGAKREHSEGIRIQKEKSQTQELSKQVHAFLL